VAAPTAEFRIVAKSVIFLVQMILCLMPQQIPVAGLVVVVEIVEMVLVPLVLAALA
jgi:hypothetical protein